MHEHGAERHPSRLAEDGEPLRMTESFSVRRKNNRMSKSSTTTSKAGLPANPHPGEVLLEEFLKPMMPSQNALARAVHVAPRRVNEIGLGKRDIPPIPTLDWRAILGCRRVSALVRRWTMT
jgi:hypothetical protein